MVQTQKKKRILMLAAENAAIAGAKVGGMADVIRDLPLALAEHNVIVDVAMPCYGFLTQAVDTVWLGELSVNFAGREERVTVSKAAHPNLKEGYCYLFSHPLFNAAGQIYSQDEAARPFASDASKFALFNLAVASALSTEYSEPSSTE